MGAGESEQREDGAVTVSATQSDTHGATHSASSSAFSSAESAREAALRETRRAASSRSSLPPLLSAALLAPLALTLLVASDLAHLARAGWSGPLWRGLAGVATLAPLLTLAAGVIAGLAHLTLEPGRWRARAAQLSLSLLCAFSLVPTSKVFVRGHLGPHLIGLFAGLTLAALLSSLSIRLLFSCSV